MVETSRSSSSSKSFSSSSSSSPELSSHLHALPSDLRSRSMLLFNLYVAAAAEPAGSLSASEVPVEK
ncbi:hypothetical protein DY000_02056676 [Brassica cretica]|uniref:Uncharacterized protein n=1 Tax=Brassica cretica TaxID=69181 RepID=A0ABQ7AEY6_BRACR|nr:hypothetical protein DY000_02056676 [Brassica cretica]